MKLPENIIISPSPTVQDALESLKATMTKFHLTAESPHPVRVKKMLPNENALRYLARRMNGMDVVYDNFLVEDQLYFHPTLANTIMAKNKESIERIIERWNNVSKTS